MKKIRYAATSVFFIVACFFCSLVFAETQIPEKPEDYVNDYAQLLSSIDRSRLNQLLENYEKQTTNQIFIAIFPGKLMGSIEDFSVRLEEKWKIGQKEKDNGIILVIFPEDRQLRIEVGYGLEGALPDMVANQIIQDIITPSFKDQRYGEGIEKGIQAMMKAIAGEYSTTSEMKKDPLSLILFFIPLLFFILLFHRYFGLLLSLGISLLFYGVIWGGLAWVGIFILYIILYHYLPAKYRFDDRIGFWGGGLKETPNFSGDKGGTSGGSSFCGGGSSRGRPSGGGGASGGGGSSGSW